MVQLQSPPLAWYNGIQSFIAPNSLTGDNQKYANLYDKIAWFYQIPVKLAYTLVFGSDEKFHAEIMEHVRVLPHEKLLEICTGTGTNLAMFPSSVERYGADISMGMLKKAQKRFQKAQQSANLFHCEAENLPFADNMFDSVFNCGGINFFNDKQRSIDEMIRITKPGGYLMIADETDIVIRKYYSKLPFASHFLDTNPIVPPLNLVPKEMQDIRQEIICKGYVYVITFRKPAAPVLETVPTHKTALLL